MHLRHSKEYGILIIRVITILTRLANLFAAIAGIYKVWKESKVKREPGTAERHKKPPTIWSRSPNFSSRNGVPITDIILHYTTSENVMGTINWFQNPASRVSAHYVISRLGVIHQCVEDSNKAWHARGCNAGSIGIEFCANPGQQMSNEQNDVGVELLNYLMSEYRIPPGKITGHRFAGCATECPGNLFGPATEQALRQWIAFHFEEDDQAIAHA
jgi:N-acetyl-anhydromuramyl-L-alanine amidase AmpD